MQFARQVGFLCHQKPPVARISAFFVHARVALASVKVFQSWGEAKAGQYYSYECANSWRCMLWMSESLDISGFLFVLRTSVLICSVVATSVDDDLHTVLRSTLKGRRRDEYRCARVRIISSRVVSSWGYINILFTPAWARSLRWQRFDIVSSLREVELYMKKCTKTVRQR